MTCMFDQVVILKGEIRFVSLLGLKELNLLSPIFIMIINYHD